MKITALETIRLDEFPNVLWVRVHTDEGLAGLGETFSGPARSRPICTSPQRRSCSAATPAPLSASGATSPPISAFPAPGEARGRSAVDIALWDLLGKATGQPVHQLLGGLCRDRIRTYNTCAGYRYVRSRPDWGTDDWGWRARTKAPTKTSTPSSTAPTSWR